MLVRCRQILQQEESLREVAEIVGAEGLQDVDRLLMRTAELVRTEFLQQNAYSDDAFSPPERTLAIIKGILEAYDRAAEKLKQGVALDEAMK
jgi:V/A-type H+-transporting ATPase subunit A